MHGNLEREHRDMKIAVCEFREETNSFNPVICGMAEFIRGGVYAGDEMYRTLRDKPCAVGGMIRTVEESGGEIIPLYSMNGNSGGLVNHEVLLHFLRETIDRLRPELPVDGLLVSLHGATQTTLMEDACGAILQQLRAVVGEKTVIAASCDLHANVTAVMQKYADYICGYHTYPHVDFYETGRRAAQLMLAAIGPGEPPKLVRTVVPMIVPASSYTTLRGPFGELMRYGEALVERGELMDFSIFQMQPWLDVANAGSAVIAVSRDKLAAKRYASELAERLFRIRDTFRTQLYTIDEVISRAEKNNTGRPVILVDAADSSNAGACGDSPAVIEHILRRRSDVRAALCLNDARAVDEIYRAKPGAEIDLLLGGSMSSEFYQPVPVHALIRSFHDGFFVQEGPAGKGIRNNIGRTAVLRIRNADVLVCEGISAPGDPQLYRTFGIEPQDYQMVAVKACTSFRAAYERIASEICETDTPGTAPIYLDRVRYKRLPHYFHPFADISEYSIPVPM